MDKARFNVSVRDMDFVLPNAGNGRRLEVVVDGLPLHGTIQLAVDTKPCGSCPCRWHSPSGSGGPGRNGICSSEVTHINHLPRTS